MSELAYMTVDEECRLATWLARPGWREMRRHIEALTGADMKPLDELIARIRREVWRDFSEPT